MAENIYSCGVTNPLAEFQQRGFDNIDFCDELEMTEHSKSFMVETKIMFRWGP